MIRRTWSIYIVRCRDGSLYTGIATDVKRRLKEHRQAGGRSAKYLRGRGPLALVLERSVGSRSAASRLESRIKRLRKARKEQLVGRPELVSRLMNQNERVGRAPATVVDQARGARPERTSGGQAGKPGQGRERSDGAGRRVARSVRLEPVETIHLGSMCLRRK